MNRLRLLLFLPLVMGCAVGPPIWVEGRKTSESISTQNSSVPSPSPSSTSLREVRLANNLTIGKGVQNMTKKLSKGKPVDTEVIFEDEIYPLAYPILLAPVSFVDSSIGFATTVTIPAGTIGPLEDIETRIAIIAPCFGMCMVQTFDGRCVKDAHCLGLTNSI